MEATIKFSNGTTLNAEVNGSAYIVDTKPAFPEDLTNIEITTAEGTETIANGEIIECASVDSRYWFSIRETPSDVIKAQETETRFADIENALCELSQA